ncbi:MAG: VapC toxin family PIN domain ribonuclease, partial [Spirochaetales bacterium]|nr:VapC toxin family PIN domain ribonuclease [Spirochaetales bacterium]
MKYLLDTNTCIYLLNGNLLLEKKVDEIGVYSLALFNCILAELYFGAYNSKRVKENLKRINLFKKNLAILTDSESSAMLFGKI